MQKYNRNIVLELERHGFTWHFNRRRSNGKKEIVCEVLDRETGKIAYSVTASNWTEALRKASAKAGTAPKPLTSREMASKLADAERRTAELEAKLVDAQLAAETKRRRPSKEDTTPADVPVSEA